MKMGVEVSQPRDYKSITTYYTNETGGYLDYSPPSAVLMAEPQYRPDALTLASGKRPALEFWGRKWG